MYTCNNKRICMQLYLYSIVQIDFPSLNPYHAEFLKWNNLPYVNFWYCPLRRVKAKKGLIVYTCK